MKQMRTTLSLLFVTLAILLAFTLTSCGGDTPEETPPESAPTTDVTVPVTDAPDTGAEPVTEPDTVPETEPETEPTVLTYEPTGDEADRPGYAEGILTYTPSGKIKANYIYDAYWGNADGILPDRYPVATETLRTAAESLTLKIGENVTLPAGADRLFLVRTAIRSKNPVSETLASCPLPEGKLPTDGEPEMVFASVSDVHVNYVEGADFWTHALDLYESLGVRYVIISGDLTVDGGQYTAYKKATEASGFTGLIFTSIGNHEQQSAGRAAVFDAAIYDGAAKRWIPLSGAADYFASDYKGSLHVSVLWSDHEGDGQTYYYAATINNALYIFMDQMLSATGNSSLQDNFSDIQLDWVENLLNEYSGKHTVSTEYAYETYDLNIVEHALIKNFSAGDKFNGSYSQSILLSGNFKRNNRFADLLRTYTEAVWMSGHTHLGFGTSVDFIDRQYDANGSPSGAPMARSIHNSSVAQARWYDGTTLVYKETYESGSEGYVCYRYADAILYEGHAFKEYTPNQTTFDTSLFCDKVFSGSAFRLPVLVSEHEKIHRHLPGRTETTDPTATTDGLIRVFCSLCGEVMSEEVIPALSGKPDALSSLKGEGTAEDPILIGSLADWRIFVKYVTEGSSSLSVPENRNIAASARQPGYGLYFRQTADVTITDYADVFAVKGSYTVFAGSYDGNGHTLFLDNVTVSNAAYTSASALPVITGRLYNLRLDGNLKVKDIQIGGSLIQGVGKDGCVENCIFTVGLYVYGSPAQSILGSSCGEEAVVRGLYVGGSMNTRSGSSQSGYLIQNKGSGASISDIFVRFSNGSMSSVTGITTIKDDAGDKAAVEAISALYGKVGAAKGWIPIVYDGGVMFAH